MMAIKAGKGEQGMTGFRGPDNQEGDDRTPAPLTEDNEGRGASRAGVDDAALRAPAGNAEQDDRAPAKRGSPQEDRRAAMFDRFAAKRQEQTDNPDLELLNPDNIYGKLSGTEGGPPPDQGAEGAENDDQTRQAPAKPGPSDSEGSEQDQQPQTMTLVVNGRTLGKTVAEIAALADMTEEEVAADPARAKRYAQKELSVSENLEYAKSLRRETPSRTDDAGARPASDARHQGGAETGDDGHDQQPGARDTSDADEMAKLVEDIQIGDPNEVAPKLAALIEKQARRVASGTVRETAAQDARKSEIQDGVSAFAEFLGDHPELADKPTVAAAMARQLEDEYRSDLRKALIAEGENPVEVDQIIRQANPADIRNAHLERRLRRDPNVRRVDKAMAEGVYTKVIQDLGGAAAPNTKGLNREQRKEALPHQPRRASVPPAQPKNTTQAEPDRKAVRAEMAQRTGRSRSAAR